MTNLLDLIGIELAGAFDAAGYDRQYGKASLSNRPDLCEFQCNGALAAAKQYKKAPIQIADEVANILREQPMFSDVDAVKPGFLNLKISPQYLAQYLRDMQRDERFGCETTAAPRTIIVDYGGANVAKPLHVGHLRSAIIGESIKRMYRYMGHRVIGDVHLGDWGLQMGLIITELKSRKPGLVYFDAEYEGEYPQEAPFTISELEEIYPTANAKSKEDAAYRDAAMQATYELQKGRRGYRALWRHILDVSVADLKKNYDNLDVSFDLWKGESDADPYIAPMAEKMKADGFAYPSDGALVVNVGEETDAKEVPPCMILKSDGASLYTTTDLATIVWRMKDYHPDEIVYLADKRQELHFVQVFRCARRTGLVDADTALKFIGFGTMNGRDGKPFKTRDGGVMRLETLVSDIQEEMYRKISENQTMSGEEARRTAEVVALSAIKYGDLSNQASKDYIFDIDRFLSFEGNTGPYILYTIVRIKSILKKYEQSGRTAAGKQIADACAASGKDLMLQLAKYGGVIENAAEETAPHKICSYIYDLANELNRFYHGTKIMAEEDEELQAGYIRLLELTRDILETCIGILGFSAPERM